MKVVQQDFGTLAASVEESIDALVSQKKTLASIQDELSVVTSIHHSTIWRQSSDANLLEIMHAAQSEAQQQDKLENLFSKFLGTGTQSLKKFVVLLTLRILEYILSKNRIPPDKIFLFDAILYFILYFCNYLY